MAEPSYQIRVQLLARISLFGDGDAGITRRNIVNFRLLKEFWADFNLFIGILRSEFPAAEIKILILRNRG